MATECNCGTKCNCGKTQDANDYFGKIGYVDYGIMADFREK